MKQIYRLGVLVGLLLITAASAYAAPACPAQATNADGTTITNPTADQVVTSPLTVKGVYFGSFEGVVPIQILDANGAVLVKENAKNECCVLSPYEQKVSFNVSAATPACVVVYRESGADGSLTPLAQVPVTLAPATRLPGTGDATGPSLALLLVTGLALVGAGIILWRRTASKG
jgi:Immunoglobulin-like domain of bacterial spore germination